ncbi:hypothetical protein [Actinoplanes sp. NPDC026670]
MPGNDRDEIPADELDEPQPSIMRQLLSCEDAERLEIAPGQWYLPGTPP